MRNKKTKWVTCTARSLCDTRIHSEKFGRRDKDNRQNIPPGKAIIGGKLHFRSTLDIILLVSKSYFLFHFCWIFFFFTLIFRSSCVWFIWQYFTLKGKNAKLTEAYNIRIMIRRTLTSILWPLFLTLPLNYGLLRITHANYSNMRQQICVTPVSTTVATRVLI